MDATASDSGQGVGLRQGFSGAPIWDDQLGAVIAGSGPKDYADVVLCRHRARRSAANASANNRVALPRYYGRTGRCVMPPRGRG